MQKIIAYEMICNKAPVEEINIECVLFHKDYWKDYMQIYNECFYKMRKNLKIEPVNFYSDFSQMREKGANTFLYVENSEIIGAVSCYRNEIDDLIVRQSFQGKGIGKVLLIWAMHHIKQNGYEDIILHVAACNKKAISLYEKAGFSIQKIERVR